MRVLTVYAHQDPKSFCHAVLEEFTRGLEEAGHASEVVDLYAIRFDPVFRMQDSASYVHESMPPDILEAHGAEEARARGRREPRHALPRRALAQEQGHEARWPGSSTRTGPRTRPPSGRRSQRADGLAFISPVIWLHFPAILKGWFERVFAYGDAYALTPEGWTGDMRGRVPLLHHEKALVISTTLFREEDYDAYLREPMTRMIDDWGLRYPGDQEGRARLLLPGPGLRRRDQAWVPRARLHTRQGVRQLARASSLVRASVFGEGRFDG